MFTSEVRTVISLSDKKTFISSKLHSTISHHNKNIIEHLTRKATFFFNSCHKQNFQIFVINSITTLEYHK